MGSSLSTCLLVYSSTAMQNYTFFCKQPNNGTGSTKKADTPGAAIMSKRHRSVCQTWFLVIFLYAYIYMVYAYCKQYLRTNFTSFCFVLLGFSMRLHGLYEGCKGDYLRAVAILSASTFIQNPPITERALKPTMRPVLVSYQSLMGTRDCVSLI